MRAILLSLALFTICIQASAQEMTTPTLDLTWATSIQKQVDFLKKEMKQDVRIPAGTIVAFYGDSAPKGWMLCDGSTIPGDFDDLRKVVGDRVPDLRGMFLRGSNAGRSDGAGDEVVDRKTGTYQVDMIKQHAHTLTLPGAAGNKAFNPNMPPAWGFDDWHGGNPSARTSVSGGAETRPKNVAVNFIIKN